MLGTPVTDETDLSSLKLLVYGGSPMPMDLLQKALEQLHCGFGQMYGLTETSGGITYLPPEDHVPQNAERLLSCGRPLNPVEIRIVGAHGRDLPAGEIGEVTCRSPQNMKGYWKLPEETASALQDGWFHTGDAGWLDPDGYLYIHDRIKDMIVTGGENVYPAEVERVLSAHPAISELAVIGVPDERMGEAVKAVIVRKQGAEVAADEIVTFARGRMAGYKIPSSVDFVDSLPRNSAGKVLKRDLRAPYWSARRRKIN
jgi:acyl-CoA synthetase (AMP-forming)/AMP-acid ligase II